MKTVFSSVKVKRSFRDFHNAVTDLLDVDFSFFKTRVKRLFHLIQDNREINHIVNPFLQIQLNIDEIEVFDESGWGELFLPDEMDNQIAYALQLLSRSLEEGFYIEEFTVRIFSTNNFNEGIYLLNKNLLHPCMRELLNKINDLVEDEVEGKDEIPSAALQIIKINNITTGGGDVAIGKDIIQKHSQQNSIKDELIEHLIKAGITETKIDSVDTELEVLSKEAAKNQVDKPKLRHVLSEICKTGGKEMLSLIKEVIRKPEIISAIETFLT